jgi:2'-5' RNA ligase
VWAGCGEGAEALVEVAGNVEKALVDAGFPAETRPFSAHLTLGRVKDPAAGREVARRVQALPGESYGRVLVDQVVLFSSVLSPSGPAYTPLQRVRLG